MEAPTRHVQITVTSYEVKNENGYVTIKFGEGFGDTATINIWLDTLVKFIDDLIKTIKPYKVRDSHD